MSFFVDFIWFVPLFSLIVFLIISTGNMFVLHRNNRLSAYLTLSSSFLGAVFGAFAFIYCYISENVGFEKTFSWLSVDALSFDFGFMVDNLSVMMVVMVCFVSLLVQIFSMGYMKDEPEYSKFFGYLALFNFSMCSLVLSPNLFQAYIFWEMVGLCSYLLIGFWYWKNSASKAAYKAFIVNRAGDFGFLLGMVALGIFTFNYWLNSDLSFLSFADLNMAVFYLKDVIGGEAVVIIGLLFLLASCAKSAQFPLYVWLPDAMEAPTPVSALIHAATMVVAGVFLLARMYPLFEASSLLMGVVVFIGIFTALLCGVFALLERDLKRVLAYSTCSQLGYMFFAIGLGAYSAGIFHMFTHSFAKALLFLAAGCVVFALGGRQDIFEMGGLRKRMPVVAYSFLAGIISLSGLFFSGFYSKECIFHAVVESGNVWLSVLFCGVGILTAFYLFRVYFFVFEGDENRSVGEVRSIPCSMIFPVCILACVSVLFGFLFGGHFGVKSFDELIYYSFKEGYRPSFLLGILSVCLSSSGVFCAYLLSKRRGRVSRVENLRFVVDWFYEKVVSRVFGVVSRLFDFVDRYIVYGVVYVCGLGVNFFSILLRSFSSKNVGVYVVLSMGWLILLFIVLYGFKELFV